MSNFFAKKISGGGVLLRWFWNRGSERNAHAIHKQATRNASTNCEMKIRRELLPYVPKRTSANPAALRSKTSERNESVRKTSGTKIPVSSNSAANGCRNAQKQPPPIKKRHQTKINFRGACKCAKTNDKENSRCFGCSLQCVARYGINTKAQ